MKFEWHQFFCSENRMSKLDEVFSSGAKHLLCSEGNDKKQPKEPR